MNIAGACLFLSIPSLLSVEAGHTFVLPGILYHIFRKRKDTQIFVPPAPDALLSKTSGGIQAGGHSYSHRASESAGEARKAPFPCFTQLISTFCV